jgi:membrane fusion protein (multidrug efflux system)
VSWAGIHIKTKQLWQDRKPEIICGLLCFIVLASLTRMLVRQKLYIETENATLQGYAIALSSEVEGEVLRVFVDENQPVKKGQLLCVIEDSRWLARLKNAEAERDALKARWDNSRRDEERATNLFRQRAISAEAFDRAQSEAKSLFRQMKSAEAQAYNARVNYQRTRITAPSDGVIAFRTARPGFIAQRGFPLFGFVDRKDRWVLAKVREDDLPDLHIGKPVQVRFDSIPDREFKGNVESISPATEKPFYSAIPADFSAGNFTKYVQWYPIRIRLALNDEDEARVPVGVSSTILMKRD